MSAPNWPAPAPAPSDDAAPVLLATLPRARDRRIALQVITWQGNTRFDLREQVFSHGEWRATIKGIGIRLHEIDALIEALVAAKDGAK